MFRTIESAFWTDPKVRALGPEAKLLFLYCVTNPHTHVGGIYYLPDVVVAHETGLPHEGIDTLWDTLSGSGLVRRDKGGEVVWVVNMLRYQGRGAKILRGVATHIRTLHKCRFLKDFLDAYPAVKKLLKGYPMDRVSGVGPGCPQDQDQEKDQEGEEKSAAGEPPPAEAPPKAPKPRNLLFDAIQEATGLDPRTAGASLGRVAAKLKDGNYTPDDVRRFVAECPLRFPWAKGNLTASFLCQNIGVIRTPIPEDKGHGHRNHARGGFTGRYAGPEEPADIGGAVGGARAPA